jgi:hypothetical protein
MRFLELSRYALCSCVAAAMLAGCGGLQPPIGAPAMPQTYAARNASWMLPEAATQDLLYISNEGRTITVYTYTGGRRVGTLRGFQQTQGECSDSAGNVFITDYASDKIVEYAHAGVDPIRSLTEPPYSGPYGCSVDSFRGTLCVANMQNESISVYSRFKTKPRVYSMKDLVSGIATCAYDERGDMFVAGANPSDDTSTFAYLPHGSMKFVSVQPGGSSYMWFGVVSVQWDGKYWEIASDAAVRYTIESNGQAIYEGETDLPGIFSEAQAWIVHFPNHRWRRGTQIVAANEEIHGSVNYWTYPGGKPIGSIDGIDGPFGATVSLAPR